MPVLSALPATPPPRDPPPESEAAFPFAPASPRWAHRAAIGLLAILTLTTLVAIRIDRDPPRAESLPASRRATLLLSISDGLLTAPLRIIDERVEGKLSGPQAANALQASAERARAAFRQLSLPAATPRPSPSSPAIPVAPISPAMAAASASTAAQLHSLSMVLERLSNSLRIDDLDGARRVAAAQLAPASAELERALSTLAASPAEAEQRHRLWAEDHEEADRMLVDGALAAGWVLALSLLWVSARLRRQTERLAVPRPALDDAAWRDCLRLGTGDAALEGVATALVRAGVADLVCIARAVVPAEGGSELVIRQLAAGPAVAAPPWPGDPLLLPGRWNPIRALRSGEPVMLGEHLSDLGTTFAWPGCPACARALLLPLWRGPVWSGCLAVFTQAAEVLTPETVARLRGVADAISTALGRAGTQLAAVAPGRDANNQELTP